MKYRKLRVAWSVAWGVVAVLLVALWVRSYWKWDRLFYHSLTGRTVVVGFLRGDAMAGIGPHLGPVSPRGFAFETLLASQLQLDPMERGFAVFCNANSTLISVPQWFLILVVATIAVAPWLRRRYSLRTLLIATTLVGVVPGIIVWTGH